jgi:hypothetical protein
VPATSSSEGAARSSLADIERAVAAEQRRVQEACARLRLHAAIELLDFDAALGRARSLLKLNPICAAAARISRSPLLPYQISSTIAVVSRTYRSPAAWKIGNWTGPAAQVILDHRQLRSWALVAERHDVRSRSKH